MVIKIGTIVDGRYRILGRIGRGGMAEVYEATDIINKNMVAIKFVREDVMKNAVNIKRFENEALIAASLNHPNIVKVYNHGTLNGVPYMANEYIKGQNLKEVLDFRGPLPLNEVINYMIQLTDALAYAHEHGIVHRDVKPENMFLMTDGTIKLGDFGIAQADNLDSSFTKTSEIIGSVYYMAPEIAKGEQATKRSDIYAAGIVFFELLTGHPPFERDTPVNIAVAHIRDKFPSIRALLPNCPKEIERIIFKATKKNPYDRYQDAQEFEKDLEEVKKNPELLKDNRGFFSRLFGFK